MQLSSLDCPHATYFPSMPQLWQEALYTSFLRENKGLHTKKSRRAAGVRHKLRSAKTWRRERHPHPGASTPEGHTHSGSPCITARLRPIAQQMNDCGHYRMWYRLHETSPVNECPALQIVPTMRRLTSDGLKYYVCSLLPIFIIAMHMSSCVQ